MTAPRACVEAVLSTVPGRGVSETHAEEIASAVLRAFVEGDTEGCADHPTNTAPCVEWPSCRCAFRSPLIRWRIQGCNTTPYPVGVIGPPLLPHWIVYDSRYPAEACAPLLKVATIEQARAVANVVNYLEAPRA